MYIAGITGPELMERHLHKSKRYWMTSNNVVNSKVIVKKYPERKSRMLSYSGVWIRKCRVDKVSTTSRQKP